MTSFIKKVFLILILAAAYYILERYLQIATAFKYIQFCYAQPLVNSASVIFGPFVGSFASGLGEILLCRLQNLPIDWPSVLSAFLNCGIIGFAMKDLDIKNGFFMKKDVTRYNTVHLFSSFGCWAVLYPVTSFLFKLKQFIPAFHYGFGQALGMCVTNFVAGTLLLSLYAKSRITAANFYRS